MRREVGGLLGGVMRGLWVVIFVLYIPSMYMCVMLHTVYTLSRLYIYERLSCRLSESQNCVYSSNTEIIIKRERGTMMNKSNHSNGHRKLETR